MSKKNSEEVLINATHEKQRIIITIAVRNEECASKQTKMALRQMIQNQYEGEETEFELHYHKLREFLQAGDSERKSDKLL